MPLPPQVYQRRYRVKENRPIADGIFRLLLEATDPSDKLPPFKAGQWVNMTLLNPDGSDWAKAAYSIASAPSAGTQVIELGIKREGDYTKRAEQLAPGDEVTLQGPWGIFCCRADASRHVLFAGGIGVTPFVSALRECVANRSSDVYFLFYSACTAGQAAYLDELRALAAEHKNIRLIPAVTRETSDGWEGETCRFEAAILDRHLSDYGEGEYLLCGPRAFMDGIREILLGKGVEKERIKEERFG